MIQRRQPVADRAEDMRTASTAEARPVEGPLPRGAGGAGGAHLPGIAPARVPDAERAARATLRAQIAKLENELSELLADRFPFIAAPLPTALAPSGPGAGPRLPELGELESTRDRLAARLQETRVRAARRGESERRARELLERMRLEPERYRYYRVPVRDLGGTGCGVYEVRPRLGLIGMLAGWWQLTLSSGCPLCSRPHPPRRARGPGQRR